MNIIIHIYMEAFSGSGDLKFCILLGICKSNFFSSNFVVENSQVIVRHHVKVFSGSVD